MRSGVIHLEERPYIDAFAQEDSDQEFLDAEEGARPAPRALSKQQRAPGLLREALPSRGWARPF